MLCSILYALDEAILEEHSKPVVCGHSNRQQNKRARHKHLIRKRIHGNQQLRKHQQPSKQRTHSTYAQCEACISGNFCWVVAYDNFLLSTWLRLSVLVRQPPSKSCQTNYEQFCSWLMLANQRWLARNRRQEATNRMKLKFPRVTTISTGKSRRTRQWLVGLIDERIADFHCQQSH